MNPRARANLEEALWNEVRIFKEFPRGGFFPDEWRLGTSSLALIDLSIDNFLILLRADYGLQAWYDPTTDEVVLIR